MSGGSKANPQARHPPFTTDNIIISTSTPLYLSLIWHSLFS